VNGTYEAALYLRWCGEPAASIMRWLGVPERTLYSWLHGQRRPRRPHPQREEALAMMRAGHTDTEVHRALGITRGAAGRWRAAAGLPPSTGRVQEVPNDGLRDAFVRSGLGASEVARRAGWLRPNGLVDDARVRTVLGLRATSSHGGRYRSVRKAMSREDALALCRALHVDPVDAGF
jgi:hypothetical protein